MEMMGSSVAGPKSELPESRPEMGAQGSNLYQMSLFWRQFWSQSRYSRSRPDPGRIGPEAQISADRAEAGARTAKSPPIPSPGRPFPGGCLADETSGLPWTTPIDDIIYKTTPKTRVLATPAKDAGALCSPSGKGPLRCCPSCGSVPHLGSHGLWLGSRCEAAALRFEWGCGGERPATKPQ